MHVCFLSRLIVKWHRSLCQDGNLLLKLGLCNTLCTLNLTWQADAFLGVDCCTLSTVNTLFS
jgi:hypothetical protein